jgi:SAM-dependent methyltransferase
MTPDDAPTSEQNLREYAYPHLYDLENAEFAPQGPFYQALAEQTGGPVLELGCGTGRLTIPLARAGLAITGLDIVPAMLERAQQKTGDLSTGSGQALPVQWVEADVRRFQFETRFRLIFATTGVFEHMLTRQDQEALLARVREHLAPDGLFALDAALPKLVSGGDVVEEQPWFSYEDEQGRTVEVSGTSRYDPATQINVETATRRWQGDDGQQHVHRAPLALHFFEPHEITNLLQSSGFRIVAQYGDYERGPVTAESTTLITVCSAMATR